MTLKTGKIFYNAIYRNVYLHRFTETEIIDKNQNFFCITLCYIQRQKNGKKIVHLN